MGKKKKQEKQKKKIASGEKALLKTKKKAEKETKKPKTEKADKTVKGTEFERIDKAVKEPKGELSIQEVIMVFRALGDESRMAILSLLEKQELCAMELLQRVSIVQSTLSHHMKVLTESGLVNCRRDNKRIYYSVSAERMEMAAKFLNTDWAIPHSNASVRCRKLRESDWE